MELFSIFQHVALVLQQQLYSFGSVSPSAQDGQSISFYLHPDELWFV